METNKLKKLWDKYDAKLDENWSLNMRIIKEINLQKTKSSVQNLTVLKILSLIFQFTVVFFLADFIFENHQNVWLTLPAYIATILTYIALIWNFYQMGLIFTIKYDEPIISIQKKIEQLKIQKLRYNKFIFYASYPYVFLMAITVLHIDLTYLPINWVFPNIILAVIWFPFCYWLINKYNSNNLKSKLWKSLSRDSTLTPDSVSKSLNKSLDFLKEIRNFEQTC